MESSKKKNIRRSTARQVLALLYWRKDNCKSKASALRKAGYSEAVARQPHKVFGSPSLRDELFVLGVGDELSQYQKERGATLQEWKVQIAREEEKKVQIDDAISQITPEQISILRRRLIEEAGYDTRSKVREPETDYPSTDKSGGLVKAPTWNRNVENLQSFSSM